MVALDDTRWQDLSGSFNNGSHTAALLQQAYVGADLETWYDDLFQELCHQYTVSPAAFAALPHLVKIAESCPDWRLSLLVLAGGCVSNADKPPENIAAEYEADFISAASSARVMLGQMLSEQQSSGSDTIYLFSALAAFHGYPRLARSIEAPEWS
jgi:hypothetical protein